MATKTRARFAEPESSLELANKNTHVLRYDSLASVLTNLDKHATVLPGKFKLDRISSVDSTELAELLSPPNDRTRSGISASCDELTG